MIQIIPIGPGKALFPCVGWDRGEVVLLYSTTGGALMYQRYTVALILKLSGILEASNAMHAFVRIAGDWVIYKIDQGDLGTAILRQLDTAERRELGLCTGNWPVGIRELHHAWQWEESAGWRGLTVGPAGERMFAGAGTGLAYLQADGTPVLNDENRWSVPGMVNPQRTGDFIAGEKGAKGLLCRRVSDGYEYELWPGEETQTPQVATDGTALYVTCWSPADGVRLARVDPADFQPPHVIPPPPTPAIGFSLDGTVGHITTRIEIATHRWQFNGSNAGVPNDRDTYDYAEYPTGVHRADVKAQTSPATGSQIIYAGTQPVIVPVKPPPPSHDYHSGWLGIQGGAGADVLPQLRAFGWRANRVEAHEDIQAVLDAGSRPIVMIRGPQSLSNLPRHPLDLSLWNEPNAGAPGWPALTPSAYATLVRQTIAAIRVSGQPRRLWIGEINNPSQQGIAWLRDMLACVQGYDFYGVTMHWYSHKPKWSVDNPHPGYPTRDAEQKAFLALVPIGKQWACSETGFSQAPWTEGFLWWKHTHVLNDGDVDYRIKYQRRFYARWGADFLVIYTYPCAAGTSEGANFGIRRYNYAAGNPNGPWKNYANQSL